MRLRAFTLLSTCVGLLHGCSLGLNGFECGASASCGAGRTCVDSSCATADSTCASGLRWDDSAGSRENECTTSGDGAVDASTDAGGDAAATPAIVCGVNAFCDGFEETSLNADDWSLNVNNATVAVDRTKPHAGNQSFHVTTNSVTGSKLDTTGGLDLTRSLFDGHPDQWLRLWMYIASPLPHEFAELFYMQQSESPSLELQAAIDQDDTWSFNNLLGSGSPNNSESTTKLPADQWFCIQYHMQIGNPGLVEMGVNGSFITPVTQPVDNDSLIVFHMVWNGQVTTTDPGPRNIWYDDVVLAPYPISCDFAVD